MGIDVHGSFGANGVKVHNGAVWVSNSQQGLLLRIPIGRHGVAGPMQTKANVAGIDDFVFTGSGDTALAAAGEGPAGGAGAQESRRWIADMRCPR